MRLVHAACLAVALLASAPGCQKTSTSTPRAASDAYASALDEGRLRDAYDLLSTETRQELSYEDFVRLIEENPTEVRALVEELKAAGAGAEVRATITSADGERLEMVYENGAWRVEASAVELYPQGSPQDALHSFVKAYDQKRWDVLLRFVPASQKEGLDEKVLREAWTGEQSEEMNAIVEGLRVSIDQAELELVGERATMSYAGGGTVELLLEDGAWKIEDFR